MSDTQTNQTEPVANGAGAPHTSDQHEAPADASTGSPREDHDEAEATDVDPIEALQTEVGVLSDRLTRQIAEFQNYRRRTQQELIERAEIGKNAALTPLLAVVDDFERALEEAEKSGDESPLREGIALVYRNFAKALEEAGVEPIPAEGEPFDPDLHEALLNQPAPEGVEAGTVLSEIQRGYRRGDRVLRHARVIVAA
jgi:molecular chaperone GrpE